MSENKEDKNDCRECEGKDAHCDHCGGTGKVKPSNFGPPPTKPGGGPFDN